MAGPDAERERATKLAQQDFGEWLVGVRRPISQKDFAETSGLSPQLVSNVEKGHRRATDSYLRKAAEGLSHPGGWKHMREIRDFYHAQRMVDFIAGRVPALLQEGVAEESAQVQALLEEAQNYIERVENHPLIVRSLLKARSTGKATSWDPDRVRAELPPRAAALLPSAAPGNCPPEAPDALRRDLLAEIAHESEQLPTSQLLRVLGFMAALPRE